MKFHGVFMEFHGIPWNAMEFHGFPWSSMEFHGVSIEFHMECHVVPWIVLGVPRNSMEFLGVLMEFYGML